MRGLRRFGCLQRRRILRVAECREASCKLDLESMPLCLLTHEMAHIMRFSQRLRDAGLSDKCAI